MNAAPILDATVSFYGEPESLFELVFVGYAAIPYRVRVSILLATLVSLVAWGL